PISLVPFFSPLSHQLSCLLLKHLILPLILPICSSQFLKAPFPFACSPLTNPSLFLISSGTCLPPFPMPSPSPNTASRLLSSSPLTNPSLFLISSGTCRPPFPIPSAWPHTASILLSASPLTLDSTQLPFSTFPYVSYFLLSSSPSCTLPTPASVPPPCCALA